MQNLYDALSTLFIFLALIWILIVTSGFTSSFPGLFSIVNKGVGRDTTRYNDINIYDKTRAKENSNKSNSSFLKKGFVIYTFIVILVFIMTVVASKIGV